MLVTHQERLLESLVVAPVHVEGGEPLGEVNDAEEAVHAEVLAEEEVAERRVVHKVWHELHDGDATCMVLKK